MTDTNNTDGAALLPVPCHFCKSGTIATTLHAAGLSWAQVECTNDDCSATGPCGDTEAEAVAAWNALAALSTPQRQEYDGEAVREALDELAVKVLHNYRKRDGLTCYVYDHNRQRDERYMRETFAELVAPFIAAHPAQATPSAVSE